MNIAVSQELGAVPLTIFRLEGDLLHEEPLLTMARQAYDLGTRYLLLDLQEVGYISSGGLRALHETYNLLRGTIGEDAERALRKDVTTGRYKSPHLKLLKPSKNALRALKVAGFDMFLDVLETRAEAVAAFSA